MLGISEGISQSEFGKRTNSQHAFSFVRQKGQYVYIQKFFLKQSISRRYCKSLNNLIKGFVVVSDRWGSKYEHMFIKMLLRNRS